MTAAVTPTGGPGDRGSSSTNLADVVETVLDKGVVIDAHVSVAVVGIQLLTIDARVVIASVDTYLRFAEAVNRLDLAEQEGKGLPEVLHGTTGGALERAGRALGEIVGGGGQQRERKPGRGQREED